MIKTGFEVKRSQKKVELTADLCVVGGGIAGVCCAITAAREGIKVLLVQDRPVLGGNASSEVRLWVLGATAHSMSNSRWAREGGVIDEILVENMHRNKEGNPILFDSVVLEKVKAEPNITLLLNTNVFDLEKSDDHTIASVLAYCSQNETLYKIKSKLFCDSSGDGIVGYLAGAPFRFGAETMEEFGEKFAPDVEEYGELLGHSIFFYTKDTGKPVKFIPNEIGLKDIEKKISRYKNFNVNDNGCLFWWIEYGGRLDTIHDTEEIKWELWRVVYGVWDYIKNSGNFPEAENLTLEWVGAIPGKRESRRFEGAYMLTQKDIVEQLVHPDAVSYGGWSVDLHPADGVYSPKHGCNQYYSKGIYQIPYRCLYTHEIKNLFLAGRIISSSHVAFGSTRVMGTCSNSSQAVGMAATICIEQGLLPADIMKPDKMTQLQNRLIEKAQHIPGISYKNEKDLAQTARLEASSQLLLDSMTNLKNTIIKLDKEIAQMIPLQPGSVPKLTFYADVEQDTELRVEFRISKKAFNHAPELVLFEKVYQLKAGKDIEIQLDVNNKIDAETYGFACFFKNPLVQLHGTDKRITGMMALWHERDQDAEHIGFEDFEFWVPMRRPDTFLLCFHAEPEIRCFQPENVTNGIQRPTTNPNAWVADTKDANPEITLKWDEKKTIREIVLCFDSDFDHPMESVLRGHPENDMPYCIKHYCIYDDAGNMIYEKKDNYVSTHRIKLDSEVRTTQIRIAVKEMCGDAPAALFTVRCY